MINTVSTNRITDGILTGKEFSKHILNTIRIASASIKAQYTDGMVHILSGEVLLEIEFNKSGHHGIGNDAPNYASNSK